MQRALFRFFQITFDTLASLRLAVVVLLSLSAALAAATFLESGYDTQTAQFWVYQSTWFYGLLLLLGLNILTVALSRWPWKPRHTPFLLAHLGIIMVLVGSWMTARHGLDGNLVVSEGESSAMVELPNYVLAVSNAQDAKAFRTFSIPWIPPNKSWSELKIPEFDLVVSDFITHAEAKYQFTDEKSATPPKEAGEKVGAALFLRLKGGPMRITKDMWLWDGDASWTSMDMGPLKIVKIPVEHPWADDYSWMARAGQALMVLGTDPRSGALLYQAFSMKKKKSQGRLEAGKIEGSWIDPGWKGVRLQVKKWISRAVNRTQYLPSRTQYGQGAPSPAIQLNSGSDRVWLGLGERAVLQQNDRVIELSFLPRRVVLPFSIQLERFEIERYEGTQDPKSYSSTVKVLGEGQPDQPIRIAMNEPLEWKGFTFYQASYIPGQPRPTTSVFSVNRDPGRWWKYCGSLLIVLGSVLLFAVKWKKSRKRA